MPSHAMTTPYIRLLITSIALLAAAPLAKADDLRAARARIEQRVGEIDALKQKGVLGENNRGFLEVRSGDDGGVAAAENADRALVYAALARQTGATAEAVGRARAKRIAANSAPGVWVQAEDGKWSKK